MDQLSFPLYDSAEEATQAAIIRSGKEFKEVAHALWPALRIDTAYARLKGALNPDRPEKLTADEHLRVANVTAQFDFLYYAAHVCSHSRPQPVSPTDEKATLQAEFNRRVDELRRITERIERVEPRIRAVS